MESWQEEVVRCVQAKSRLARLRGTLDTLPELRERRAQSRRELGAAREHLKSILRHPVPEPAVSPEQQFGALRWHALDAEAQGIILDRMRQQHPGFARYAAYQRRLTAAQEAVESAEQRALSAERQYQMDRDRYVSTRAELLALFDAGELSGLDCSPVSPEDLLAGRRVEPLFDLLPPLLDRLGEEARTANLLANTEARLAELRARRQRHPQNLPGRCPHCGATAQAGCACRDRTRRY